jgi:hypothetical protein
MRLNYFDVMQILAICFRKNILQVGFYTDFVSGGYGRVVDVDIVATAAGHIPTKVEVDKFIINNSQIDKNKQVEGRYDTQRARIVCTTLELEYQSGPYLAFFDECPSLPHIEQCNDETHNGLTHQLLICPKQVSAPLFVLKFGGLNATNSLKLLDKIEQQLLRSDVNPTSLKLEEFMMKLSQWCKSNKDTLVQVLKIVKQNYWLENEQVTHNVG